MKFLCFFGHKFKELRRIMTKVTMGENSSLCVIVQHKCVRCGEVETFCHMPEDSIEIDTVYANAILFKDQQ